MNIISCNGSKQIPKGINQLQPKKKYLKRKTHALIKPQRSTTSPELIFTVVKRVQWRLLKTDKCSV